MWPKRTVGFYAEGDSEVWDGIRVLLNELGIGNTGCTYGINPAKPNAGAEPGPGGAGDPGTGSGVLEPAPECSEPVTELVFGPGHAGAEPALVRARAAGLVVRPLVEFVHRVFAGEVLVLQPAPGCEVDGLPLLWRILQASGYEPSLLWPDGRGGWRCQRGRGIHWVIPAAWWAAITGTGPTEGSVEAALPRAKIAQDSAIWVVRGQSVDFYGQDGRYLGSMARWSDQTREEFANQAVAAALGLGVPWREAAEAAQQCSVGPPPSNPLPQWGGAWWEESLLI